MDPYKVLGVSRDADDNEIRRAFHRAAKDYHPDKNPNDIKAEERFKEISEAYELLSNGGGASFDTPVAGDDFSLDDVLSELFSNPFKRDDPSHFPDLETTTEVLNIRIPEATAKDGGKVIVPYGSQRLRINIPSGTYNGQKLRLKGIAPGGEDVIVHVYLD